VFAIREPLTRIADPGPDGSVIGHNEKGQSTSSHLGVIGRLRLYAIVELRSRDVEGSNKFIGRFFGLSFSKNC